MFQKLTAWAQVGYGDLYPESPLGRIVASITAFLGEECGVSWSLKGLQPTIWRGPVSYSFCFQFMNSKHINQIVSFSGPGWKALVFLHYLRASSPPAFATSRFGDVTSSMVRWAQFQLFESNGVSFPKQAAHVKTLVAWVFNRLGTVLINIQGVKRQQLVGWRPSRLGWRPLPGGWRPLLLAWRPLLLRWRPLLVDWTQLILGWRQLP